MRSPGLDAASVALPAGIDLDDRAAPMNEFWRALVAFRSVLVVAICVDRGAVDVANVRCYSNKGHSADRLAHVRLVPA